MQQTFWTANFDGEFSGPSASCVDGERAVVGRKDSVAYAGSGDAHFARVWRTVHFDNEWTACSHRCIILVSQLYTLIIIIADYSVIISELLYLNHIRKIFIHRMIVALQNRTIDVKLS